MYLWKLTRDSTGYEEPIVAIVQAEDENSARLTVIAVLAKGSDTHAADFALDSTTVEKIGTAEDSYGGDIVHAIESTDFREITLGGTK